MKLKNSNIKVLRLRLELGESFIIIIPINYGLKTKISFRHFDVSVDDVKSDSGDYSYYGSIYLEQPKKNIALNDLRVSLRLSCLQEYMDPKMILATFDPKDSKFYFTDSVTFWFQCCDIDIEV
jgi:hypothetical protein